VGLSPDTAATLLELSASAGTDRDLTASLRRLLDQATAAVPSCVAVSLTVSRHGVPLTLAAYARDEIPHVRSSVSVHLPASLLTDTVSRALTLYSAAAGAFGQLTVDLLELLDLDPRRAVIDGHLTLSPSSRAAQGLRSGLDDLSTIDQALGVLIDRGLSIDEGLRELERLAAASATTVSAAAVKVMNAVRRGTQP
jgi:hypothetical protein